MASDLNSYTLYQAARESKELPRPDAVAQAHSEKLIELIVTEIEHENGAISFKRFMERVLYAPALGYYAAGSIKLGNEGDFITAPEISSLFSYSIANAILPVLELPAVNIILEVGAGSGRMAANILLFLAEKYALPEEYWILELSADLRERQYKTIENSAPDLLHKVKWLDTLPEKFSGVVVANELLDAMPVQLFQKNKNEFSEIFVSWDGERFQYRTTKINEQRLQARAIDIETELGFEFSEGYISEVNFAAEDWIQSIAERLEQGMLLLVDYGFPRHEYYHAQRDQGTLMCHYRHRSHHNPFVYPGLQDITAHVDFTAIADAALAAGMKVTGYTNQVSFLMGAGLIDLAAEVDQSDLKKQMNVASEIKKLTLPQEMGELFKVIGLSKNCDVILPAFLFRDLREYL